MKITLSLLSLLLTSGLISAQNIEQQQKVLKTYNKVKTQNVLKIVEQNNKARQARIDQYLASNPLERKEYKDGDKLYEIFDIVESRPIYRTSDNSLSARASKINKLHPGGGLGLSLEGDNMTVGVWDEGWVLATHTEFLPATGSTTTSRVTNPDAGITNPISNSHGTHVAGTIGARGANASAKGMAPKVKLRSYNWSNDNAEVISEASANALLISNHSYGTPIYNNQNVMLVPSWYMGCYDDVAVEWDEIAYAHPYYLMVASAGNNGTQTYSGAMAMGYDKLTGNKNSKNNLVVANANPTVNIVTGNLTALAINPGSSQGPSDDGRIKPDIAADGTNLLSTYDFDNNSYATLSGTSMSSPTIAGALILLQEHYENLNNAYMLSATLKGLVCHTAIDNAAFDDFAFPGPDPKFGWGLLDAEAAANVITRASNNQAVILESVLDTTNPTYSMTFSVTDPTNLKATLCWLDPAGTAKNGSLNSTIPALVNDLDLRISNSSETFLPWKLNVANVSGAALKGDNTVDNVERVEVTSTASGQYTVTVTYKSFLVNDSQPFSLILSGTGITLNRSEKDVKAISIFPNPTNDILNFNIGDLSTVSDISIIDVSGKVIASGFDLNAKTIDVANLQSGVYFVRFVAEGKSLTRKFIKL